MRARREPMRGRRDRGAALVEYAMLMALVVVVSLAAISALTDESDAKVAAQPDRIGLPSEDNALNAPPGDADPGGDDDDGGSSGPVTAHVGGLSGATSVSNNDWSATITITVVDDSDNPVQGATVTGSWSVGTGGTTCTPTSASGTCSITSSALRRTGGSAVPSVTFTIGAISGTDVTYDGSANSVSALTVNNPG